MGDVMTYVRMGLEILGAMGLLASLVVRLTPSPKDDEFVSKARAFLAMLATPLLGGQKVTQTLTHAPSVPTPAASGPEGAGVKRLPLKQR